MKAQNRKEIFLKSLAKGSEVPLKPLTREEILLKKQAEREKESSDDGCDWNTMKNKPFGETTVMGDTLTWDGDTTGKDYAPNLGLCRVTDNVFTPTDVTGGKIVLSSMGIKQELTINEDVFFVDISAQFGVEAYGFVNFDGDQIFAGVIPNDCEIGGIGSVRKGLYFLITEVDGMPVYTSSLTIDNYTEFERVELTTIQQKFLPEHLQFGKEVVYEDVLTWDGNKSDRIVISSVHDDPTEEPIEMDFIYMSETVPTLDDLSYGGNVKGLQSTGDMDWDFNGDELTTVTDTFVTIQGVVITFTDNVDTGMGVLPKAGIYFANHYSETLDMELLRVDSFTLNNNMEFSNVKIKPLKYEYLPTDAIEDLIVKVLTEKGLITE